MRTAELHFRAHADDRRMAERCGDEIHIETYSAWSGDTETGFGQHTPTTLNREEALQLAAWIQEQFA